MVEEAGEDQQHNMVRVWETDASSRSWKSFGMTSLGIIADPQESYAQ
jgi:hypothetical protein